MLGGERPFLQAADEHDLPLQALGAVDGAQRHALALGAALAIIAPLARAARARKSTALGCAASRS